MKIKKLISIFIILEGILGCINVSAADNAEEFVVNVKMLSEKQLSQVSQKFTEVDLKNIVNRDLRDEVAGDHQGGWSDQGDNDLRTFTSFGNQEMLGVPFYFINPANNNQKAVLGLRGQNDTGLPTAVDVPVNKTVAGAYFVHASPWANGTCGKYTWVYRDGTESYVNIDNNVYICDFWGKKSYDYCRPVWSFVKPDGSERSIYLFAMNNPHPEKPVKNLRLETSGGGAYIMILGITLTDSGPYLPATESARLCTTSTFGWYDYSPEAVDKISESAADFSFLLDAPAGKHGKIEKNGEQLLFEDGTRAAFWGGDIKGKACFPEKADAEKIAKRLSFAGINLVRLKGLDEYLTGENSAENYDRLYYFISELKNRGIYTYVSLFSDFFADDREVGIEMYFDDEIIRLEKEYVNRLFNTVNPYTKKTLAEDECVVMAEACDEKSILMHNSGYGYGSVNDEKYKSELNEKFNSYLKRKYSSNEGLMKKWTQFDKLETESLDLENISLGGGWRSPLKSDAYKSDVFEFLTGLQEDFFIQVKRLVGDTLFTGNSTSATKPTKHRTAKNGESIPLAYENDMNDYLLGENVMLGCNDFTAKNYLYAETLSKSSEKAGEAVFSDMFKAPVDNPLESGLYELAENALYEMPFAAEYGCASPNLYFSAFPVLYAAIGGQNSWNLIYYNIANGSYQSGEKLENVYSAYGNPVRMAMLSIGAQIFYSINRVGGSEVKINKDSVDKAALDFKKIVCSNQRYSFNATSDSLPKADNSSIGVIKNNNIYWSANEGFFEVRTPYVEAMTGYYDFENEMPSFKMSSDNLYTTAALSSVDGNKISSSERLLFTAVCGAQNTDTLINTEKNYYMSSGDGPVQVEAISGRVTLKLKGSYRVYALSSSGERTAELGTVRDRNGYLSFNLTYDNKAIQYEIVKGEENE